MKYDRLNLFKEIVIGFKHGLQTISESPASVSDGFIVQINKCCRYPCLQFIFAGALSRVGFSLNCAPHIIIEGVTI